MIRSLRESTDEYLTQSAIDLRGGHRLQIRGVPSEPHLTLTLSY